MVIGKVIFYFLIFEEWIFKVKRCTEITKLSELKNRYLIMKWTINELWTIQLYNYMLLIVLIFQRGKSKNIRVLKSWNIC